MQNKTLISLKRILQNDNTTIGILEFDNFACFTIEDIHRDVKVMGETRIPAGTYDIKLRTAGGFHTRYLERFRDKHHGMLWLQDVPNFEWVYLHPGNSHKDTSGCILPNYTADTSNFRGGNSVSAYLDLYKPISQALLNGGSVSIVIED